MIGSNYWLVNDVSVHPSTKARGSVCYHITFVNLKTRLTAKTYVESTYGNYRYWRRVIEDREQGQILTNLKVRDINGKIIVSADSRPHQEIVTSREEVAEQVAMYWSRAA